MATKQISIEIPEHILRGQNTDAVSFALEMRRLSAVKLYELGRISSGGAADLAGLSRIEFLRALGEYKVFPFQSELAELEQNNG